MTDTMLRSICGWPSDLNVPSESTFSHAFAEFAEMELPSRIHDTLIQEEFADRASYFARFNRDRCQRKASPKGRKRQTRGKSRRQQGKETERVSSFGEIANDGVESNVGGASKGLPCKRNAQGHSNSWMGFKLHMDTTDEGIPVSCVVTAALLHDSQAAIPLLRITEQRVTNLYDLMDAAYDAQEIILASLNSGHVPIVDMNPRNKKAEHQLELKAQRNAGFTSIEQIRYRNRRACAWSDQG